MKYVNTGEIENWGLELSAHYALNRRLSFNGNYSWLHMENPVTGSPKHKLYLAASPAKILESVNRPAIH